MSLLGPVGNCTYNGYDLNSAETFTVGFSLRPQWDSAGRTIVYVEHLITIKTVIYNNPALGTIDALMDSYRKGLMQPCGAFVWEAKGGGSITANIIGSLIRDVCYGPKPQGVKFSNIHQYKTDLEFSILVCLPVCPLNSVTKYSSGQSSPLEFNFTLEFAIDTKGWTTRTYSGHFICAASRLGPETRTLSANADAYRPLCVPLAIPTFRRQMENFKLNEAKTRLDFTVVDVEMGLQYPPAGITNIQASQDFQSAAAGCITYNGTLTAIYDVQKGTSTQVAYDHFIGMIVARKTALVNNLRALGLAPAVVRGPNAQGFFINTTMGFSAREVDIFGATQCSFTSNWFVTTGKAFQLLVGGLWTFINATDTWDAWSKSQAIVKTSRGIANLSFNNSNEVILDLCDDPVTPNFQANPPANVPMPVKTQTPVPAQLPPADASWATYTNSLSFLIEDSTVVHCPLAIGAFPADVAVGTGGANINTSDSAYRPIQNAYVCPPPIIYQRSAPISYVVMSGEADRVGYQINPPTLFAIDGKLCIPANQPGDGFTQTVTGFWGVPIYHAQWRFRYLIQTPPYQMPVSDNPIFGAASNGGFVAPDQGAIAGAAQPNNGQGVLPNNAFDQSPY